MNNDYYVTNQVTFVCNIRSVVAKSLYLCLVYLYILYSAFFTTFLRMWSNLEKSNIMDKSQGK